MALKIALKPHERMIISGAVLKNGKAKADFTIENKIPILRERDIMGEEDANSPCRRIYFVIQLMYIDNQNLTTHHHTYWKLVKEVIGAAPSTVGLLDEISRDILNNKYYQALKKTKKLIDYEKEVLDHVSKYSFKK